jgi:hypothetical protein
MEREPRSQRIEKVFASKYTGRITSIQEDRQVSEQVSKHPSRSTSIRAGQQASEQIDKYPRKYKADQKYI